MHQQLHHFWEKLPHLINKAILALVILLASWLVALLISSMLKRISRNKQVNIMNFLVKLVRNIILIIGLVSALGTLGINVTALVASLGLASFAVGYAFKDMLSNSIAGFMIMLNDTVKTGDRISVSAFEGKVKSINLRYTVLINNDKQIYIPNGTFNTSPLTIFTNGES